MTASKSILLETCSKHTASQTWAQRKISNCKVQISPYSIKILAGLHVKQVSVGSRRVSMWKHYMYV